MIIGYTLSSVETNVYQQQIYESLRLQADCVYTQVPLSSIKKTTLNPEDILIVSDISCLGTCLREVRDNLDFFFKRQIRVVSLAERYEFLANESGDYLLKTMDLVINIRKSLASKSTIAALQRKKDKGFKLGRVKGIKLKKMLDGKEKQIRQMLTDGINKSQIARELGVSRVTLYNFIKEHALSAVSFAKGRV